MSTRLHIVLSDETVADIDRVRGDVPRSAWIRRLIVTELFGPRVVVSEGGAVEIPSPAPAERPEKTREERQEYRRDLEAAGLSPGQARAEAFRQPRPAREFKGPYDPFGKSK